MARVQFLNGILSGKLGGTVYAHNKAGYYVRQYSIPTNPNTIAQADARDEFAASVTSWHLLGDIQKSFWNTYASADFKGKYNDPTVLYSGFNAFVSLWNIVKNANRKQRAYEIYSDGTTLLGNDPDIYSTSLAPPSGVFSANIKNSEGNPLGVVFLDATMRIDGNNTFDLGFFASPGPQADAPIFVEPNTDLPVGYAMYASNVISQAEHFVTKPNQAIVGVVRPPADITSWNPGDEFIRFLFTGDDPTVPDHKLWYDEGDLCRVEIWAVGQTGPIIRVGEKIVSVAAALP